tara:strand:- start:6 stop:377 length:372 start_codon:yes stop_codon:yes gene_type:complete
MELIIHNNQIDVSNIQFKRGKNNMKLLYKLQSVFMIGICLELKPTFIIKEYCPERIEITDEKQLKELHSLDTFFSNKFNNYISFIKDKTIFVKNNTKTNKPIYININNIKCMNDKYYVNIFSL